MNAATHRLTLFALLTIGACDEGAPSPETDPPAGHEDPATGRWFGTVSVVATIDVVEDVTLPGSTLHQSQRQKWWVTTTIDESGAWHTHSRWSFDDFHRDVLEVECFQQTSTNVTRGRGQPPAPMGDAYRKYFALRAKGDDGYASGESMGLVQDMSTPIDTRNRVAAVTCDGAWTDSSTKTQAVLLGLPLPFDRITGELGEDKESAAGQLDYVDEITKTHYELSWHLKRDKPIVAVVGGPYHVTRGERVTLDGSDSRGDIERYTRTVTPDSECSEMGYRALGEALVVGHEVEHDGETFEFPVLCPVRVKLTVTGPDGEDSDEAIVTVDPRETETQWVPPKTLVETFDYDQGGTNHCSVEGLEETGHYLHHEDASFASQFEMKQITDAGTPFEGAYYVATQNLQVSRTEYVNVHWLAPNGETYKATFAQDPETAALLESQARAHEAAHSSLLEEYLDFVQDTSLDPSVPLEGFAANDESSLEMHASAWLRDADTQLCSSTTHTWVHAKLQQSFPQNVVVYWPGGQTSAAGTPFYALGDEVLPCQQ